jgi:hypothetical protein
MKAPQIKINVPHIYKDEIIRHILIKTPQINKIHHMTAPAFDIYSLIHSVRKYKIRNWNVEGKQLLEDIRRVI